MKKLVMPLLIMTYISTMQATQPTLKELCLQHFVSKKSLELFHNYASYGTCLKQRVAECPTELQRELKNWILDWAQFTRRNKGASCPKEWIFSELPFDFSFRLMDVVYAYNKKQMIRISGYAPLKDILLCKYHNSDPSSRFYNCTTEYMEKIVAGFSRYKIKDDRTKKKYVTGEIESVYFSPDGKKVVFFDENIVGSSLVNKPFMLDLQTWKICPTFGGMLDHIESIAFSSDGSKIATCSINGVKIRDVQSGNCLQVFEGEVAYSNSVSWVPNANKIVVVSRNGEIELWDTESGRCIKRFGKNIESAVCLPGGTTILAVSKDGEAGLWDMQSEECKVCFSSGVSSVSCSRDGTKILLVKEPPEPPELWEIQKPFEFKYCGRIGKSCVEVAHFVPGKDNIIFCNDDHCYDDRCDRHSSDKTGGYLYYLPEFSDLSVGHVIFLALVYRLRHLNEKLIIDDQCAHLLDYYNSLPNVIRKTIAKYVRRLDTRQPTCSSTTGDPSSSERCNSERRRLDNKKSKCCILL